MSVKSFLAPLTVDAISVVNAVEAAESISRLPVKFLIKDALPGLPVAITDFSPGGGPGSRQEQREAKAAAQPESRHGRAGPAGPGGRQAHCPLLQLLQGSLPGTWQLVVLTLRSSVLSFSLIRWFYRLFYLTQS